MNALLPPAIQAMGMLYYQFYGCMCVFIFLQEEVQRKENSKVNNPAKLGLLSVQTVNIYFTSQTP